MENERVTVRRRRGRARGQGRGAGPAAGPATVPAPGATTDAPAGTVVGVPAVSAVSASGAFGVSRVSADGFESPVVFPGAAGAFWRP